ncbi:hypothetical protein HDU67_009933 [Dinochytrium kinnereticum]|nr:hypothetical protein HDU67_009933 [Dinochytrium kinnereticum]
MASRKELWIHSTEGPLRFGEAHEDAEHRRIEVLHGGRRLVLWILQTARKCIFVGCEPMGYRLFNPITRKIIHSKSVVFDELNTGTTDGIEFSKWKVRKTLLDKIGVSVMEDGSSSSGSEGGPDSEEMGQEEGE